MNVGSPFPWRVRALSRHASRATLALLLVPILGLVVQVSANASTASAGCADPMPYKWLPPGGVPRSNIDASGLAALAKAKADLDAGNTTLQTDLQRARALSGTPADVLRKRRARAASSAPSGASKLSMDAACGVRGAKRGSLFLQFQNRLASTALAADSVSSGPGYAWLDNLNEQGQDNSFYCGPATVSESTYTESVAVSQATAGGYMGTDGNGTSTGAMTSGMQHFVGYPVKNWSWYMWVDVPYTPSSSDFTNFWGNFKVDVSGGVPLAANALEVTNGPHLTGHPNTDIGHYVETGGWSENGGTSVYYADSATTVWSSVPPYSWYDAWTFLVIVGGRGYIW
jgi:hypothetical protein